MAKKSTKRTHVSPGVYYKETELQYATKSLGITTLGLAGETIKGPAFQPISISNWREFQTYFGGTNTEKYRGSQYPKYVRNSVDITNSKSFFPMVQLMNNGKTDLVVETINKICNICSYTENDESLEYTKSSIYGVDNQFANVSNIDYNTQKKYSYSVYDKDFINSWKTYCIQKYGKIVE